MPESQLLIGLETSFKNGQKALNVTIYYILKAYICCYPLPPSVRFVHLWKCWHFWTAPYVICNSTTQLQRIKPFAYFTYLGLLTYWTWIPTHIWGRDSSVGKASVSHTWGPRFESQWGLDLGHINAWMIGEEITSCKSHIAPVSLTDWCIMIFILNKNKLNK